MYLCNITLKMKQFSVFTPLRAQFLTREITKKCSLKSFYSFRSTIRASAWSMPLNKCILVPKVNFLVIIRPAGSVFTNAQRWSRYDSRPLQCQSHWLTLKMKTDQGLNQESLRLCQFRFRFQHRLNFHCCHYLESSLSPVYVFSFFPLF